MYSLLIVDDEMIISDGLYYMLQDAFQDRLEVRHCYDAEEAKRQLTRNRIDILITDIEMPGDSGIALHRQVQARWPMIRVIYLTGYAEFDYVRQAMQQNALAYVLKNEGDQVLIDAVEQAIRSLEEENNNLLRQASEGTEQARQLRQLCYHGMQGGKLSPEQLETAMADSGLPFLLHQPVYLGYCMFDPNIDAVLLHQSMKLIEQLIMPHMPILLTDMNVRCAAMLYQPASADGITLISGHLEVAQRLMEAQGTRLTICLLDCPGTWLHLDTLLAQLFEQINQCGPTAGELVLLHGETTQPTLPTSPLPIRDDRAAVCMTMLRQLKEYLLTGQQDLFRTESSHFWQQLQTIHDKEHLLTIYHAVGQLMEECKEHLAQEGRVPMGLLPANPGTPIALLQQQWDALAEAAFAAHSEKQQHRQQRIVKQIDRYIDENLSGDLSLTTIADALHFHPTYISRMYKEHSGMSLSDRIAQQRLSHACTLLQETDESITSIATKTGFATANYFARWFRKWMSCTAQDYREKAKQ